MFIQGKITLFKRENVGVFNKKVSVQQSGLRMVVFKSILQIDCKILQQINSIKLLDSSYISLPNSMENMYKGYGTSYSGYESNNKSDIKLQLVFDYLNQTFDQLNITEGIRSDQGYRGFE